MSLQALGTSTTFNTANQLTNSNPPQKQEKSAPKSPAMQEDKVEFKSSLGKAFAGGLTGLLVGGIGTEVATTLFLGKHAMGPVLAFKAAAPVAVAGAVAGGIIATSTDNKAFSALGGAMVGAIAGAGIGMPGVLGGAVGGGLAGLAASFLAERVK